MGRKPEGNGGRVIKRYPNRKLYDTAESRYITLNEIAALLREGHEVSVFDSRTGEDITSVTLAQVLVGEEKNHRRTLPIQKMAALIHSGGEFIQKKLPVVTTIREEAERKVHELLKHNSAEELKEILVSTHHAYEEVQRRADEQIQFVVSTVKSIAPLARDISELRSQVRELSERVAELEQKAGPNR
ncbi:MAG TPA: polyhydroxyalkanoate synthesis regulator DNA-binding domain-containing protein [Myxococcota bacterium]|nr:polyhydroxyalkanoate synthesis regulator DNA-binding domain-containing protein [Myxococcota bacterium]HOC99328.1 polyhydroxyalkanoate synthesis regulator DNA-binding domain-containing protein [Myxococcota bacterium]HOH76171.1 polyhydroxyalkanoate synthesis regulator DNA-binding domain-containing protein [Myxococcota bacterium]HPV05050.1 polyhydroxyalkanoate synthesis regulator DNA-binding domain-containing protein [Myxococcota bacterium]